MVVGARFGVPLFLCPKISLNRGWYIMIMPFYGNIYKYLVGYYYCFVVVLFRMFY